MKKLFLAVLAAALAVPLLAAQDQKDQTVPPLKHEVVVTATRVQTPVKEVASSLTVIGRTEIERSTRFNVLDLIQDGLGADYSRNGGPGAASSLFLRGANSEHVLVLLDGVEINDPMNPSRSYDFAHMTLDNIERIEVLRGPQSTLYGSDALAGVVNILTRRGSGKPQLSLDLSGGAYGTARGAASLSGSSGPVSYSFGLSEFYTRGFSAADDRMAGNTEKDGYRNFTASGNLIFTLSRDTEAGLTIRSTSARTDLADFGGPYGDDPNNVENYDSLFLRGYARTLLAGGRWEMTGGLSYVRTNRTDDNPSDPLHPFDSEQSLYRSGLAKIDWQNNLFLLPGQTLTFGADLEREQGDSSYHSETEWGPYDSLFPGRSADQAGVYAQDQVRLGGRFFATAGVRLDDHSRTGAALTYRFAPALVFDETGTKLKATIGTGFKSPSLYQLYAPGTLYGPIGNESLHPEQSLGCDAGIEQDFWRGRIQTGLTYFRNDFRNLIDYTTMLGYINVGRARTDGVEASVAFLPAADLELRLSYTRLRALDLDTDAPLLRRPKDKASADLRWKPASAWDVRITGTYVGARPDQDFNTWPYPVVSLAAYFLLDADLSFDAGPKVQIYLRGDNLLDVRYETVYGYGTPRRSVYAGVRVKLGALNRD
ncbi:MAG: TonB-dependent receptor [Candidatus Aminicenantales bacterium]